MILFVHAVVLYDANSAYEIRYHLIRLMGY